MKRTIFALATILASSSLIASAQEIQPSSSEKLESIRLAIEEALRLSSGLCGSHDPRLCGPTPDCDAEGRRPEPWFDCVLAWRTSKDGGRSLTWVDEWMIDAIDSDLSRPRLSADGKLL